MTRPLDAGVGARLDAAFDRALAEQRIVGGVVLVSQDGRPAYARAGGLADRAANRAMTHDTIFRMASLTKLVLSVQEALHCEGWTYI